MAVAFRGGPSTSAPSDGSRTITLRDSQPREEGDDAGSSHDPAASEVGRIPLRGGRQRPRVVWAEDTVDNEHMGKKSSKSAWSQLLNASAVVHHLFLASLLHIS